MHYMIVMAIRQQCFKRKIVHYVIRKLVLRISYTATLQTLTRSGKDPCLVDRAVKTNHCAKPETDSALDCIVNLRCPIELVQLANVSSHTVHPRPPKHRVCQ